jgi:hypothetical protein
MKQIMKYTLIAAFTIFTGSYIIYGYMAIGHAYLASDRAYYLIALLITILYLIILRKRISFFENLLHELTHMLFSMLTFRKVSGLYVSATNGAVYTEGSEKSMLVTLSPYFFPLLTAGLLVLFRLIRFEYSSHLIIASYALYLNISVKHLIKDPYEILSTGPAGCILLLMLNFWISYLLLQWLTYGSLDMNEILTTTYDGFKRTISQFKLV